VRRWEGGRKKGARRKAHGKGNRTEVFEFGMLKPRAWGKGKKEGERVRRSEVERKLEVESR
jgi:hypothetical protein